MMPVLDKQIVRTDLVADAPSANIPGHEPQAINYNLASPFFRASLALIPSGWRWSATGLR
jgi:hypothetical protein